MLDQINIACADCRIEIRCSERSVLDSLRANFALMEAGSRTPDLEYRIDVAAADSIHVRRDASLNVRVGSLGELLYLVESDVIVQLQFHRRDLLFLHAAAVEYRDRAILLVGRSGAGKSTTCWGLLHHGFRYLSDELAPVAPDSKDVLAFPHALCMKRDPPSDYPVPDTAWRTSRGVHVPVSDEWLPSTEQAPHLGLLIFVEYDATISEPQIRRVSRAEAAARLYPNILNALAHGNDGLAVAAEVASQAPAFKLQAGELRDTCDVIQDCVRRVSP